MKMVMFSARLLPITAPTNQIQHNDTSNRLAQMLLYQRKNTPTPVPESTGKVISYCLDNGTLPVELI